MISINTSSISTAKMTDRSVVSACMLGVSNLGTGLSGIPAVRPASSVSLAGLPVRERNERPTKALEAAVVGTGPGLCLCGGRCRIPEADDAAPHDVGLPWARTLE